MTPFLLPVDDVKSIANRELPPFPGRAYIAEGPDELFDAINTAHLSAGHRARDITHNKISI